MDEYIKRVRRAAQESNGTDLINNRTTQHAAVIVAELFRKATTSVQILCQRLRDSVYGDPNVIGAAVTYLNEHPDASLEIVVENDVSVENNAFLRHMKAANLLNRIILRKLQDKHQGTYQYNFMLVDGTHYRYEPDRSACEAVALFGNTEDGKYLQAAFDSLRVVSPEVAL